MDNDYITLEEIEDMHKKNIEVMQKNVRGKGKILYPNIDGTSTVNLMKNPIKTKA